MVFIIRRFIGVFCIVVFLFSIIVFGRKWIDFVYD